MNKLSQYITQDSILHRRDPRVKILAVLALSIIILQANGIGLLLATVLVLGCSQMARISPGLLLKSSRSVWPFFICLMLLYLFSTPGQPLPGFPIGPIQINKEGLTLGIVQIGKFLLLVLAASLLTITTTESEITVGLERLLRPLRVIGVSSHDIAMMIALALRFLPVLADEMNDIREAQLARGADFGGHKPVRKIEALVHMAAPFSINIFRRCDDLVDAMEARGYHAGPRTYLQNPVLNKIDYWVLGIIMIALIIIIAMML